MKPVSHTQGSPAWHAWRYDGIGASEISAVLGLSPYTTREKLLASKCGGESQPENSAMRRGHDLEDEARRAYEDATGESVSPVCCEHPQYPFLRASLDGVTFAGDLLVEIKCPSMGIHDGAIGGSVPAHYMMQVQMQMLVAGIECAHYVSYHPDHPMVPLAVVKVFPDHAMQEQIVREGAKFWHEVEAMRSGRSLALAVDTREAQALAVDAQSVGDQVRDLVVDSAETFQAAAAFVSAISAKRKEIDRVRKSLLEPVREIEERIQDLFRKPLAALDGAERHGKRLMSDYQVEQERIREAERAIAFAEAQAKLRAEREAAQRAAEEARAALAATHDAAEAEVAGRVLERAEAAVRTADVVRPMVAAPATEIPKAAGISSRTTWVAEVVDLHALLSAAITTGRADLLALITVDMKALNAMARTQKERFAVPGCQAVAERSMAVRA